jgi:nucleoid DNA-binding protein
MKPPNMHIKDFLIKKIAINKVIEHKMISEKVIHKVIAHQFDSANDAIHKYNSVEFSGFGKFMFNMNKAKKKMELFESQISYFTNLLNDETLSPTVRRNLEMKLATAIDNRVKLKPKIDHGSDTTNN